MSLTVRSILYDLPFLSVVSPVLSKKPSTFDVRKLRLTFEIAFTDRNLPPGFPKIRKSPTMKVVEKGRDAVLVCEASGKPQVDIHWIKDTRRLVPNPRYRILDKGKLRGEKGCQM
jgi:hypothetical protein